VCDGVFSFPSTTNTNVCRDVGGEIRHALELRLTRNRSMAAPPDLCGSSIMCVRSRNAEHGVVGMASNGIVAPRRQNFPPQRSVPAHERFPRSVEHSRAPKRALSAAGRPGRFTAR